MTRRKLFANANRLQFCAAFRDTDLPRFNELARLDLGSPSSLSIHPFSCQFQSMCLGFFCRLEHLTVDPLQLDKRSGSSGRHGPVILTHPGRREGKRAAANLKAFGSPL
jgi:hypothetical protein